jgi:hypothetical protein
VTGLYQLNAWLLTDLKLIDDQLLPDWYLIAA